MKASRSLFALAALVAALLLGACKSNWEFWKNDAKMVAKSTDRNLNQVNKSLHRHFLNTDWDDPYLDD